MLKHFVLNLLAATAARPLFTKYRDPALFDPIGRAAFLGSIPSDEFVLEIGPFDRPSLKGTAVRYFDLQSQEGMRARAAKEATRNPEGCPFIHFASATGDLSVVDEQFDVVFSSHCIEHQPDLIRHLRQVERILRPGGRYFLIVPDKRFCFDHFLPESQPEQVLAAKGRSLHTQEAITKHAFRTTHNFDVLHWLGIHGRPGRGLAGAQSRNEDTTQRISAGEYVDVHAWQFTPASFHMIVQELFDQQEIYLQPTRVHNTGFGMIEFMAVLTRTPKI
jgi:SAM-dependent methyltransferase